MSNTITKREALETARDCVYSAFEVLAEREDVPDALVAAIQATYRAIRAEEVAQ